MAGQLFLYFRQTKLIHYFNAYACNPIKKKKKTVLLKNVFHWTLNRTRYETWSGSVTRLS